MGCLCVLALLNLTDGPSAVLWTAALAGGAAVLFAGSGLGTAPEARAPLSVILGRTRPIAVILVLAALANGLAPNGLAPVTVKGRVEAAHNPPMLTAWNSFSRIAVFDNPSRVPRMWGPSPNFRPGDWAVEQRVMNIDGDAGTFAYRFDGDLAKAGFLKYDVTNLAYFLPGRRSAAIIGVDGGRDVLAARVFGVGDITGVEINPIFIRLLTGAPGYADFSGLSELAGVRFVVDEARSWFARPGRRFDVIQMSLADTWAATGAGAYTLSENGLYTVEAWRIFLDRLTPAGVFTVSRWYAPGEVNETGRMVSLAVAALIEMGAAEPSRHVFLAASGRIATLVVSRAPLAPNYLGALDEAAAEMGYTVLASPGASTASPVLGRILASTDRARLHAVTAGLPLDLTPPTDERPFFFNQLPLASVTKMAALIGSDRPVGVSSGNLAATATLVALFLLSAALVLTTIVLPLRSAVGDGGRSVVVGGTLYFLLIGVGFMSVEIGLLQRMSVFLGHPVYSLSVVLFSLILSTGAGSLLSDRLALDGAGKFAAWSAITGAYLMALPQWLPGVALAYDGAALPVRALVCVLTIAPAGLLMGYGFPTGMRLVSAVSRAPTPWFWGINGAAGVLASALAVASSIAFGIGVTLVIGSVCYLLLAPAALVIGFGTRRPAAVAAPRPA